MICSVLNIVKLGFGICLVLGAWDLGFPLCRSSAQKPPNGKRATTPLHLGEVSSKQFTSFFNRPLLTVPAARLHLPSERSSIPCGSGFLAAILYLFQQMTAKRSDLMTQKAYDAKLDES